MFFTPDLLKALPSSQAANDGAAIMSTFQWLLILGFPIEVAAAKAMPQLFSEKAKQPASDGVRVWA